MDEKRTLEIETDLDGTAQFEKESLDEEIKEEIVEAVFEQTLGEVNTTLLQKQDDEEIKELDDEEKMLEQADNLNAQDKLEIDHQLRNEMYNKLVQANDSSKPILNATGADEVFVNLIEEEANIENLDIASQEKIYLEESLEKTLLKEPVTEEIIEYLTDTSEESLDKAGQLEQVIKDYQDHQDIIDVLDGRDEEMVQDFKEDILDEIVQLYKPELAPEMVNETEQVLEKLEKSEDFVQDLLDENILNATEVNPILELNALEDLAQVC